MMGNIEKLEIAFDQFVAYGMSLDMNRSGAEGMSATEPSGRLCKNLFRLSSYSSFDVPGVTSRDLSISNKIFCIVHTFSCFQQVRMSGGVRLPLPAGDV